MWWGPPLPLLRPWTGIVVKALASGADDQDSGHVTVTQAISIGSNTYGTFGVACLNSAVPVDIEG